VPVTCYDMPRSAVEALQRDVLSISRAQLRVFVFRIETAITLTNLDFHISHARHRRVSLSGVFTKNSRKEWIPFMPSRYRFRSSLLSSAPKRIEVDSGSNCSVIIRSNSRLAFDLASAKRALRDDSVALSL